MESKEGREKSRDSDCAPLLVDLSQSWSGQSGSSGMTGKVDGSIAVLGGREGKRKRVRVSHCGAGGGKVYCYMIVIAVLLIAGQFAWTLSLQFSVVRLLDKLETVEKLADTALDLTTKVAASAAQTAAQAATAANKAVEVMVSTGLLRIQNLTDGESPMAVAVAAKQQSEAAAAAARQYAQAAALAKDLAISAAAASREKAGEIMIGFGEKLRKILHTFSQQDEPVAQAVALRDTITEAHEPEISTDKKGSSNSETASEPERLTQVVDEAVGVSDMLLSEEQMDVAVNHVSAADGEAAVADDLTPREGRGGARLRREAADRADRPRLRHNRRVPTVKTNEAEPRGEFRKRIARKVKQIPGLHLRLKIDISPSQRHLECEEDCHIYKEWEDANENHPTENLEFSPTTGLIKVNKGGLYHIYAQIYYKNEASRSGFKIMANRKKKNHERQREQIGQCMTSAYRFQFKKPLNCSASACGNVSVTDGELQMVEKLSQLYQQIRTYDDHRTCHTATTISLNKDDTVYLSDVYGTRIDSDAENANFFGLYKISDT